MYIHNFEQLKTWGGRNVCPGKSFRNAIYLEKMCTFTISNFDVPSGKRKQGYCKWQQRKMIEEAIESNALACMVYISKSCWY